MGIVINDGSDDEKVVRTGTPLLRYDENVIKRHRIVYTVPQLVRLGLLPYSAYLQYEQQKAMEEAEKEAELEETPQLSEDEPKEEKKNHTFWEDDDGEREQLSDEDYAKFLSENAVQLNTAEDMIANLLKEQS